MANIKAYTVGIILGCLLYTWFLFASRQSSNEKEYVKNASAHLRESLHTVSDSIQHRIHDAQARFIPSINHDINSVTMESEHSPIFAPEQSTDAETLAHLPPSEAKEENVQSQSSTVGEAMEGMKSIFAKFRPSAIVESEAVSEADAMAAGGHDHAAVQCMAMMKEHHVSPGSSWGTLTIEQQKLWTSVKCDELTHDALVAKHIIPHEEEEQQEEVAASIETAASKKKRTAGGERSGSSKSNEKKGAAGLGEKAGLLPIAQSNADWCHETRTKYEVKPMKSWGKLPMNQIDTWKKRQCDLVFTSARMGKRPLSRCVPPEDGQKSSGKGSNKNPNLSNDLPLIAIMAATTTRKVDKPSTSNLALFTYLLPSVIRTLDCGFRYEYVLGYDKGDPFYDSDAGMTKVRDWFKSNVEEPMLVNGIRVSLRLVRVNNTLKKPGPVFLEMARAAYEAGAAYFYRINDDTELLVNWAEGFVKALHSLPAPYGAVGPACSQGNNKILTHDFVARLHMEIFEMNYYPPQLTDWWMDDWISLVYGQARTFKAKHIPVIHHTGAHGQRYQVDSTHESLLGALVSGGRNKIRAWMLKHNVPAAELEAFDRDVYAAGFVHRDIPAAVMETLVLSQQRRH